VQIKVWLLGVSPMVWRRVVVPADCTLRELHGVFQVAMGWEGRGACFAVRAGGGGSGRHLPEKDQTGNASLDHFVGPDE